MLPVDISCSYNWSCIIAKDSYTIAMENKSLGKAQEDHITSRNIDRDSITIYIKKALFQ